MAKEQGLFHLNYAHKLKGKQGVLDQLKKLDSCLQTGNLNLTDLETSDEEIENLKNSAVNTN